MTTAAPRPAPANRPPRVRLTTRSGARFARVLTMAAAASDGDGTVASVTFLLDGRRVGVDRRAPYRLRVGTARLRAGRHWLTATATDDDGARARSARVAVVRRAGR